MNDIVFQLIRQGYTLVTANRRLARYLRYHYARIMLEQGKHKVWETPDILPWQAWLVRYWNELPLSRRDAERLLLNTSQQRCLWQQVIDSHYPGRLLQINTLVDQAMFAYALCKEWQIPLFSHDACLNQDAAAFRIWAGEYEAVLDKNHWIDHAGIVDCLCRNNQVYGDYKLAFYGFDELTPQKQRMLVEVGRAGCTVREIAMKNRNQAARAYGFPDRQEETRSAARWAKQIINRNPDASVGIIIPDLKSSRRYVTNVFDEIFHPSLLAGEDDSPHRYYNVSLGEPLSAYPLIHTALQILSLDAEKHPIDKLSAIFRSSFIRDATVEQDARAKFDAALRETGEHEWQLKTLIDYTAANMEKFGNACSLVNLLREYEDCYPGCPGEQTPAEWTVTFSERLKRFGWPGDRDLDSSEYQCLQAWNEALAELVSVGTVSKTCTGKSALAQLAKIAADTGFQPETAEAPVQIMGLTGAAGMQFDHLWVAGLHDQVWPPPVQPNPYIPLALQQQARMPGASGEVNLQRAGVLTDKLVGSAIEAVLSYPAGEADRECRISPLIRRYLTDAQSPDPGEEEDYKLLIHRSARCETLSDYQAPAPAAKTASRGGAGIFRDQAACPFRAFARHRLFAKGLAEVDIGLNAAIRGLLVHRVMQYLWQRLKSSENLQGSSGATLESLIGSVVSASIAEQIRLQPGSLSRRFAALERERLCNLAMMWLQREQERPSFTVIEAEKWHTVRIGKLVCTLRIDRIDELADGRLIILDYKTGAVSSRDWEGDRPEDPQLPLYAVCSKGDIAAIAYAKLKTGEMYFSGVAAEEGLLPGVGAAKHTDTGLPAWSDRLQEWRTVMERLAGDFLAGNAVVDPKNSDTCRYCDLHSLCRIHEIRSVQDEEA